MSVEIDIGKFKNKAQLKDRYTKQLQRLQNQGIAPACIEEAVKGAVDNLAKTKSSSLVIYGEPQSGKTEMMICLTAKLLDSGHPIIAHLMNDSVDLLAQNLTRFRTSGLAPAPRSLSDLLQSSPAQNPKELVVFCKKNVFDLDKLIARLAGKGKIVVIDDEADYATPNAKINQGTKTKVNERIGKLLGSDGSYVGVTATPARLDLNNTFRNDTAKWVNFPPHSKYNLLSMFFTRNVKHKLQQDTYIQRARMFGARGKYLKHFELTIPSQLYADWHRCFVLHKLALETINNKLGSPVWIGDNRVSVAAKSSIDNATVVLDRGEMSFGMFDYTADVDPIVLENQHSIETLRKLQTKIGKEALPGFLIEYIKATSLSGPDLLAIHTASSIAGSRDANHAAISRDKGFMGKSQLEPKRFPNAVHHVKIFYNKKRKAKLFYKFQGSLQFIQNLRGTT